MNKILSLTAAALLLGSTIFADTSSAPVAAPTVAPAAATTSVPVKPKTVKHVKRSRKAKKAKVATPTNVSATAK